MIAKMVVYGETRKLAIERLKALLQAYEIEGIKSNLPLLREMAGSSAFLHGASQPIFMKKRRETVHENSHNTNGGGNLWKLLVKQGDEVQKGRKSLFLESMKWRFL
ncbi:hypothetical protein ACEQPO_15545 [Bacillus sp. SL00103]